MKEKQGGMEREGPPTELQPQQDEQEEEEEQEQEQQQEQQQQEQEQQQQQEEEEQEQEQQEQQEEQQLGRNCVGSGPEAGVRGGPGQPGAGRVPAGGLQ